MVKYLVSINVDNDSFSGGNLNAELAGIFRELARRIEIGLLNSNLPDSNGNRVGVAGLHP